MGQFAPVTFIKQSLKAFHTTGAIAPSSSFAAKAMVRSLPRRCEDIPDNFKVLEVGAGTGPFSAVVASRMNGRGHFDIYEINPKFMDHLKARIDREHCFQAMRSRIQLHLGNVLDHHKPHTYDAILSGLPFNNFTPEEVRTFFEHFRKLAKPGGTLSFFEYVGVRPLQKPFVSKQRRTRVAQIAEVVDEFARAYQYDQDIVLVNMPPARIRHLRFS
jgi:phosphatidylethanolamine/phosphatidyl-N-methylethanolamine N-methyltransferase